MKSSLSLFLFIISSAFCSAQDWKPYVLNAKCIYGSPGNGPVTQLFRIRYDSVYTTGNTETVYAYTRSYSDDSCLNAAYRDTHFSPFSQYREEFAFPFPVNIQINNDSIVSSSYVLLRHAQKGQWWYDHVYENDSVMDILGIPDSVKIYSNHYFKRIVLSKHFGLVQLGGNILLGFKTDSLSLGLTIPPVETTLKLTPGDILYYRTIRDTSTSPFPSIPRLYDDLRDSIVSVSISGDKLKIGLIRQYHNYFDPALSYDNKSIENEYDLTELNRVFQEGAPFERLWKNQYFTKLPIKVIYTSAGDTVYTVRLSQRGYFYNCRFDQIHDICVSTMLANNIITLSHLSCSSISGGSTETTLIGSRIGNQVSGHINLGIENKRLNNKNLAVYPNPTSGILHLNTSEELNYTLIDMLGNTLVEGRTSENISLQTIPVGLYLLKLSTPEATQTFRIMRN